MRFFLDTANVSEIEQAITWGIIDGVTTNPSLIAKEGRNIKEVIKKICSLVPGPVSAEAVSIKATEMLAEARELSAIASNVVIKVPITKDGLKVVSVLSQEGIKTNVTLVFSVNQALLAARAGATFVSPFAGRLDDIGHDGISVVEDIVSVFDLHSIKTEVIAASIRHPMHVTQAAQAGAHISTVPFKVMEQLFSHPLTDSGIEKFLSDWEKVNRK